MSDATETLDDYPELPSALGLTTAMADAYGRAAQPKPTLQEMMLVITGCRYQLEDGQTKLLSLGDRQEPDAQVMRRVAVLAAAVHLLERIEEKKAEVSKVLRGSRR